MRKWIIGLILVMGICTILPYGEAKVESMPSPGWGGLYTGTFLGYPMNQTISYAPFNDTCLYGTMLWFNATDVPVPGGFMGTFIEVNATREVVYSSGTVFPVGTHVWRATPAELSPGLGASLMMPTPASGDVAHIIVGEGSVVVSGITLNCWIANYSSGGNEQSLWFENSTGMLVKHIVRNPALVLDLTLVSASNVKPDPNVTPDVIPGYDVWILLGILGAVPFVLWWRKGRSCR